MIKPHVTSPLAPIHAQRHVVPASLLSPPRGVPLRCSEGGRTSAGDVDADVPSSVPPILIRIIVGIPIIITPAPLIKVAATVISIVPVIAAATGNIVPVTKQPIRPSPPVIPSLPSVLMPPAATPPGRAAG